MFYSPLTSKFPVDSRNSVASVFDCTMSQCLIVCDTIDYSPPGSSVPGILQARILESVAIYSFRGSSPPKDQTRISWISYIAGGFFYHGTTGEMPCRQRLHPFVHCCVI